MLLLLFLIFYPTLSHAQFAEIASLATSLLGSGLGGALGGAPALAGLGASAGSAASQGGGALAQIGQLYQLAQGALQLTGTGVGVLNQASEGNWFPAALEQAAKNSKALGMGGLSGMPDLGALGGATRGTSGSQIGSEFGTGFPAPDIDDYNDNTDKETKANPKTPMGLVNIDDKDYDLVTSTTPNTTVTTTVPITLFPDENLLSYTNIRKRIVIRKEHFLTILESQTDSNVVIDLTTQSPMKQIRIELPKRTNANTSELDYIDEVIAEGKSQVQITTKTKNDNDENLIKPDRTAAAPTLLTKTRSIPSLAKLIDVLRKSSLKEAEIMEIITQVSTVPPPIHHYQLPEHPLTNARGPAPPTVDMLQLSRMQREIGSVPVSKGTQIPHYQPPPQQYQQHVQQPYYNRMPQPQYHPTNYQPNRVPPSPFPPSPPPPPHPYPGQQVQQPRSYYQYRQFQQVSGQAYSQESATRNANFNQPNSSASTGINGNPKAPSLVNSLRAGELSSLSSEWSAEYEEQCEA
uniref:DM5 domain-containing protein n=1 Tax=Heterorhabditis bacteriophora TaxID=37862 RepID=A0A1I7XVF6_HETBA